MQEAVKIYNLLINSKLVKNLFRKKIIKFVPWPSTTRRFALIFDPPPTTSDQLPTDVCGFAGRYESPDESTVIAAPASDFSFVETLWTGSFGHTVLARHDPTGRIKTIKILGVQTASDGRRRAETEKNVMAAVGAFPFVARLECLSRDDAGRVYLVMPLVSIGNLFELVADRGRLNETEARFFAAQVG